MARMTAAVKPRAARAIALVAVIPPDPGQQRVRVLPRFTLGDCLAKARETGGFTQAEMAQIFGVTLSTIGRWERDEVRPTNLERVLIVWAEVCNVVAEFLFDALDPDGDVTLTALDVAMKIREQKKATKRGARRTTK